MNTLSAKKKSILLVEDDQVCQKLVKFLIGGDYLVTEADDGLEAVKKLSTEYFDLVITDVEMPGLDGPGLMEYMRTQPELADIPVVVISSRTSFCRDLKHRFPNFIDCLRKPIVPSALRLNIEAGFNSLIAH